MSKRPVDIAHLKTLQRKRRALQTREAKEEREDKKNAVRQTTIDFFARPSSERQPDVNSQPLEEDSPFRLSSQTNAHAHNPFACSSQPEYSSQSSFSILENLSQQEFQNEYWSDDEDNASEGKESEAMKEKGNHTIAEISEPLDIKGTVPIVVKQKKNEEGDLGDSENRLVINLASQDDYKTFLNDDMSDGTESVDSDEMNDRADHDDYDISDEVSRFSRATLMDNTWDEPEQSVELTLANYTMTGLSEVNEEDVHDGRLLSVLKQKVENATAISGALDIGKTINSTPLKQGSTAMSNLTQPLAPFDWALKTSLFITSTHNFDWMQTDGRSQAKALSRFRSNHFANEKLLEYCRNPEEVTDVGYTISQCLYHWAYPNSTLSNDKIASNNRLLSKSAYTEQDKLDLQEWQAREDEWASSFRSLFDLLNMEECDYFYYIGITVCILFRSKRFVGGEVEAIGSRSTVAFRRHLKDAGVNYILPYQTNDKENEVLSKEVLSDLEYLESINPGTTRQEKKPVAGDNEKNSLFLVHGVDDVQNLVDALVTWREPRTSDRAHGPPTLISPQSFLNSTLKCAETEQRIVRKLTKSENSTEKASQSVLYKLDVHGYILPTSLLLLYSILGRNTNFEESFWVECSTQALTKGLNTSCENTLVSEWATHLPSIDQVQYTRNAYRIG
ncbi:hypothetical protein K450DRAFT_225399 [Umbelopsis ramanniana AG]|uniref:Uncharacterized protein n=1 Tax=Umbelopsis ramanniana AG TaxID=1314678 RepID=A0AAD5EG62_UMBRA|nr:uncharacterized protein K450DRAFT_225399 [Umbelopsis ramanniana AG]KAI8582909.1 hypothetical protein K450DRAFT_225399 [Umbelopsis ramanniana AG]